MEWEAGRAHQGSAVPPREALGCRSSAAAWNFRTCDGRRSGGDRFAAQWAESWGGKGISGASDKRGCVDHRGFRVESVRSASSPARKA